MRTVILSLALLGQLALTDAHADALAKFCPGQDLSGSAKFVPAINGQRGWSGFSFVTEYKVSDGYSGPIVSKPGVFELSVSGAPDNRVYTYHMYGDNSCCDPVHPERATLQANAETDPGAVQRVAGVCTYYHMPEQSRIGYLLSLYLNGELIGSHSFGWFGPKIDRNEPVVFAPGVDVRSVELGDHAFPVGDLFPNLSKEAGCFGNWAAPDTVAWRQAQKDVRFLETDGLIVAVAEKPMTGNPVLGVWNRRNGDAVVAADGLGWELEYANDDGLARRVRSSSRRLRSTVAFETDGFTVTGQVDGFDVIHRVSLKGGRIERSLDVSDGRGCRIRGTVFPKVNLAKLPGEDHLVEPSFSGVVANGPTVSYYCWGKYPEDKSTMQFVGYYNDGGDGVYFAAEDPMAVSKDYSADGLNGRLTLAYFVRAPRDEGAAGARRFASFGKGVLELYRGKWFEAGQVYRRFLKKEAPWYDANVPRRNTPEWFMKNPLWIANLNLTHGRKPAVRCLRDYFGVQTSFVTGLISTPDGLGCYGPHYTIQEEPRQCLEELRKEGVHFEIYTNSRLWYCGPGAEKSNNFSKTGKLWAIKHENGVMSEEHFGSAEGDYVDPCIGASGWRELLMKRTRWLGREGCIDGIYHDQMICCTPHVCFDPNHGHKVGDPSAWLTGGYWKFCDYLMGDLRRELPNLIHTSEESSEPYVNRLDGFVTWRYGRSGHVPLFQSLYSPRVQFVGRGCDIHGVPGSYEAFFPKYAEQLCYGEQIGWVSYHTVSYPSTRRGYLKKLAHCRAALCDFLNASEMEAPLSFVRAVPQMTTGWGVIEPMPTTTDKVLHSVWRNADGRRLAMFLNTVNEEMEVEPLWTSGGKRFAVFREGRERPEVRIAAPKSVRLAPYAFEFWLADGDENAAESVRLGATVAKMADFVWRDRGEMLSLAPAFDRTADVDAKDGKPVAACGAVWGVLAYLPSYPHVDCFKHVPEWKDGWIAGMDGGLVNYGTVDFGTGATGVEMNLATDQPDVKVELIDVTGDVPERCIACFSPAPGYWHGYKTCVSPLFGDVCGKRLIVCRVTGGICNLKNWRLLTGGKTAAARPLASDAPGKPSFAADKSFSGASGVTAAETAWTLLARKTEKGLAMPAGSYAYYGTVDFGKAPRRLEVTVAQADPKAVLEFVDITEFAPSKPLARFTVGTGGRMTADLSFKVEGRRNVVLMVRGGGCTVTAWKVTP